MQLCYGLRGQERKHAQSKLGGLLAVTGSKYLVYQLRWQSLAVVGMRGAVFSVSYYHRVAVPSDLSTINKPFEMSKYMAKYLCTVFQSPAWAQLPQNIAVDPLASTAQTQAPHNVGVDRVTD